MKKRTKLLSLSAAVVGAAALAIVPAFGDTASSSDNFIVLSDHQVGSGSDTITITEWKAATETSDNLMYRDTFQADGNPDVAYWPITRTGIDHITVQGEGRIWRIGANVTMSANNGGTTNDAGTLNYDPTAQKYTILPVCFRITANGTLHQATDKACSKSGSQQQWAG